MRTMKTGLIVVVIMVAGVVAGVRAQDSKPGLDLLYQTTMPTTQITSQPLEKVLNQLKMQVRGFHFVLYRAPTAAPDYPVLPAMQLEGVSIQQFIILINNEYPRVKISVIADNNPSGPYTTPLLEVDIKGESASAPVDHADQSPDTVALKQRMAESDIKLAYTKADLATKAAALKRKQDDFSAHSGNQSEVEEAELAVKLAKAQVDLAQLEHDSASAEFDRAQLGAKLDGKSSVDKTVVRVFSLGDLISARLDLTTNGGKTEKQVTDDVLSLIQTALGDVDSSIKPEMKMHPATQVLICKVTAEQAAVIDQVVQALQPTEVQMQQTEDERQLKIGLLAKQQEVIDTLTQDLNGLPPASPKAIEIREKLESMQKRFAAEQAAGPQKN